MILLPLPLVYLFGVAYTAMLLCGVNAAEHLPEERWPLAGIVIVAFLWPFVPFGLLAGAIWLSLEEWRWK